jgi:hypothetical protein
MRNRLRIEVKKNGKRVGTIGCVGRGVLSVTIDLPKGTLTGHLISVPGGAEYDEQAWWSFGKIAIGDIVTFHLIEGGPLSRPYKRERDTPEQALTNNNAHRDFNRERRAKQLNVLTRLLKTRKFPPDPRPRARVGDAALRVSINDREAFTAGAPNSDELDATIRGVLKSANSPSFEVAASTWVQFPAERELRQWNRSVAGGSIVQVEVLDSAKHSTPERRNRRPRSRPLSSVAAVQRAIAAVHRSALEDERRYREMIALNFHRISKRAVVDDWATIAGPMPTEERKNRRP